MTGRISVAAATWALEAERVGRYLGLVVYKRAGGGYNSNLAARLIPENWKRASDSRDRLVRSGVQFLSNKRPVPHAVTDTIVGLFLVLDSTDHEHYRTGQIVGTFGNCYLIQFDKLERDEAPQPMELHTLEELSATCENCDQKLVNL